MARDWRWRKATFDGASFYVDMQEVRGGRRLVVHEYPGAELHDVEDMGRKAGSLEVTAYFNSETADSDAEALRQRLERAGPGMLMVPMFGSRMVIAHEWGPSWSRQVLNYVGFRVTFVEQGTANAPIPIGLGAAQLGFMGAALGVALGGAISDLIAAEPQASFVRADMLAETRVLISRVEGLRAATPLPAKADADLKAALAEAAESASNPLSDPGARVADALAALDTIATEQTGDGVGVATALDDLTKDALASRKASLAQWGISEMVSIIPLAGAMAFTAEAARLRAIQDYRARKDAQAARDQIRIAMSLLVDIAAPLGVDAYVAWETMVTRAARHLSDQIPNLAPVVIVELGASLPSNVLAYRLYGDPNRAQEIVDRNGIVTPCMMPAKFEALAR